MSEETKELKQDAQPAPTEEDTGHDEDLKPVEKPVDYDAIVDQLTKERDNYKTGMLNAKAENKELKQEGDAPEPPAEKVEVDDLEERIAVATAKQMEEFKGQMTVDYLQEALINASDDPGKRKLIQFHYKNSLNPSGYSRSAIVNDVRKAAILANNDLASRENKELKDTMKAKETAGSAPNFSGRKEKVQKGPKLNAQDQAFTEAFRRPQLLNKRT